MEKEYDICNMTSKRCYTKSEANGALRAAKKHARSSIIPRRSYHCDYCGFWHLTSTNHCMTQEKHKPIKIINAQEEFDLSEVL